MNRSCTQVSRTCRGSAPYGRTSQWSKPRSGLVSYNRRSIRPRLNGTRRSGSAGVLRGAWRRQNATTTLFAALGMVSGRLTGICMPRHRDQEWLKFLKLIDTRTPAELDRHLIADNCGTHKYPQVKQWLARHPRFHRHIVPTSARG